MRTTKERTWMRRKTLSSTFDISIRMVDYVISDMRGSVDYEDDIISDGRLTLVSREAFEDALRHRARRSS